jgi:serine/threonine-protein kinase
VKHGAVTLVLVHSLAACGSRAGLSALDAATDPGSTGEPPTGLVAFPSIEETVAVPEPAQPPDLRPREDGRDPVRSECELSAPSLDTVLARIQADVLAQPAADRPFLRYVSAAFGLPSYCRMDSAVNVVADALPLLLNSLSLTENAASATPLDGEEGLLRIDLREMGWNRPLRIGEREHADGWEALSANAAQSVALRGPEADALWEELGTRTPLLHAHDLARAALGAGVYYALLDAPQTLDELRSSIGIPPELEGEPSAYWRAITTESFISRQDRVLLRYRGKVGSPLFWRTLEQRPDAASGSAFVDPLAREADESAVMYTLPNGLPAYFLADAAGRRLDESRVLLDTSEDDFVPRTAPSCVRCHSDGGVLPVVDELRPYAATDPNGRFGPRELALLAEVYPSQKDLDALIGADRRRVRDARARLGVPGAGGEPPLDQLVLGYNLDLDPALAAAELFVSRAELERHRRELPGPVRVLTSLGSLGRRSFNETYREALCVLSREGRNEPVDCP